MPPFEDWLRASWDDFRRRWVRLLTVIGVGGAATLAAAALPLFPALILAVLRIGPLWLDLTLGSLAALSAALWLSTWAQAAAVRAAVFDEPAGESLSRGWAQTAAFGWVITLSCLAVAGAACFFVVPGVAAFLLLFFAPYYEIAGEASGADALGLSWARAAAHPGPAILRLLAAFAISWAPSQIPYVGWIIAMFWAPFGMVAAARLAADLRAAAPDARAPGWMGSAVAGLTALLLAALVGFSALLARFSGAPMAAVVQRVMSGGADPQTGTALIAVLNGNATPEQQSVAKKFVVDASSAAWNADAAVAPAGGLTP